MMSARELYYGKMCLVIRKWRKQYPVIDRLAERAEFKARIESVAENGYVVIIESGMDCDCVAYSGIRHKVKATVVAVEHELERVMEYAVDVTQLRPELKEQYEVEIEDERQLRRLEKAERDFGC
jgi:hypothetical protein